MKNVIVCGLDRLGKSSLIEGLQHKLGISTVLHYQKPQLLDRHVEVAASQTLTAAEVKSKALKFYQRQSFEAMFRFLETGAGVICDRAHLGELVYAKRYRGYNGDYVIDMERLHPAALESTLLVVLYAADTSFLQDDGLSFDYAKRDEEQQDFIDAFELSNFPHKMLVDVSRRRSTVATAEIVYEYRPQQEILKQVLDRFSYFG